LVVRDAREKLKGVFLKAFTVRAAFSAALVPTFCCFGAGNAAGPSQEKGRKFWTRRYSHAKEYADRGVQAVKTWTVDELSAAVKTITAVGPKRKGSNNSQIQRYPPSEGCLLNLRRITDVRASKTKDPNETRFQQVIGLLRELQPRSFLIYGGNA